MTPVWLDGRFVSDKDAKVGIRTHALHYGTSVFEGIRFYDSLEGPAIFRLKDHVKRLFHSARVLGMKIPYSPAHIEKAIVETVRKSKLRSGYIRPIAFFAESPLGIVTRGVPVRAAIIVLPWGKYLS